MMRSAWDLISMGIALLACVAGGLCAADAYRTICFEAEAAKNLSGKAFRVLPYAGKGSEKPSGGKVLGILPVPSGQHAAEDQVTYRVNIPADDTYYLWARVVWSHGCGNSFYLSISTLGNSRLVLGGDGTYRAMHWVTLTDGGDARAHPLPIVLKKGEVEMTLQSKEGGVAVDELLLTSDPKKEPTGIIAPTPGALVATKDTPKK